MNDKAIKQLRDELEKREKYYQDWNGRAANNAARLEAENTELKAQLADMSLICADVRELTNLIVGSPPETPIKGQIESLAFELGHYPYVLNAQEKDNE